MEVKGEDNGSDLQPNLQTPQPDRGRTFFSERKTAALQHQSVFPLSASCHVQLDTPMCFVFLKINFNFDGFLSGDRVIDVGSEWRTFSNEKALKDPSRVGDAQNPLLNGGDLTTMISKVL